MLALVEMRCIEQKIEVQRRVASSLPNIRVVPDRITQVYLNLIINALDAMPNGGRLEVSLAATAEPAGIQTVISDTGTGIDPAALEHLFEPFGSSKSRGMGLGLYISHKIVKEHHGAIDVSSHLGQGSTFTIWLPKRRAGSVT